MSGRSRRYTWRQSSPVVWKGEDHVVLDVVVVVVPADKAVGQRNVPQTRALEDRSPQSLEDWKEERA
jgi:hypothetical protein